MIGMAKKHFLHILDPFPDPIFLIIPSQLAMLQGHLGHSILPSLCLLCNELLAKIKSLITSAIFGHEKQGLDYKDFSKERHDTL